MKQQATLFDFGSDQSMTITEVADTLSVSAASVRNWIKTGYLQLDPRGGVSRQSFSDFHANVVGKEKLTKRANKLFLDTHDHDDLVIKTKIALTTATKLEEVAELYQTSLSDAYRNKEGIYYTPESICDIMFSDVPKSKYNQTFCDPCCGSGNFILAALRRGFQPENIYGYDTDPIAIEITKHRIYEATGYKSTNVACANFLDVATSQNSDLPSFDVILTNPPWGKKLTKEVKIKYGKLLGAGHSLDTSSLFFFASLRKLRNDGSLGLLLPESFFKIATFQDARREVLHYSLNKVQNFGKPFKGLLTKAQYLSLAKTNCTTGQVKCINENQSFKRFQKTFAENPANIINFETCPSDALVFSRLLNMPHITLKGNARWGLGIVTGNNKKFCHSQSGKGRIPVYKGINIHKGFVDEPTTYISSDFSLYQQVAPIEIFEARDKILYRFISSDLIFYHDNEQSYCLNSVNMIVLADSFPVSNKNLVKIFNSDLFSWVFGKIFNTHKILRADIECIPVPVEFLSQKETFLDHELLEYYGIEEDGNGAFKVKR